MVETITGLKKITVQGPNLASCPFFLYNLQTKNGFRYSMIEKTQRVFYDSNFMILNSSVHK